MRKLILFAVFIGLFMAQAFSQTAEQFKIGTTFRDRSILSFQNPFKLSDTIHFNRPFSGSMNHKHLYFPGFSERDFSNRHKPIDNLVNTQSYDRMPCVRPEGYFPMPIAKPDSTIRYSLLIRRY